MPLEALASTIAVTSDFGPCATDAREPRQVRKEATVASLSVCCRSPEVWLQKPPATPGPPAQPGFAMPYQVIARKYRPQTFDDVVGQKQVTETLKNAILHDRVAHGYIFSGARGVGKTTTARILAKALNCAQGPTITPDGTCDACQAITAGNSVDVLEIDAASNRGIDEIRELRESVRYLPAHDRYKIFIIDEAHMLTTEAFNALLKTLEEPPPRSLFILATTEAHKLPTTIQSRCQHFAFRLLDYSEVVKRLEEICRAEGVKADEGSLAVIAEAAGGSLRDALSLLDQVIAGCGDELQEAGVRRLLGVVSGQFLKEVLEAVLAQDSAAVLDLMQRLAEEGHEPAAFLTELTRFIRHLMIARSCGAESPLLEVPPDARPVLGQLSQALGEEDWLRFFQVLLRAQNEMRYSLEPRFHLELALLKLVQARKLTSLEGLLGELRNLRQEAPAAATTSFSRNQPRGGSGAAVPGGQKASAPGAPLRTETAPGSSGSAAVRSAPATQPRSADVSSPGPTVRQGSVPQPDSSADDPRLAAIKALLFNQSKKFVSGCLEHAVGWRFENGEAHFIYSKQNSGSFWADVLNGRENQEALRQACAQVLGEPVRIRVTLDDRETGKGPAIPEARERARNHAVVKAFEQQFDCVWLDVEDLRRG
jgi:DNA polymerase III subunit gamma/tau